jgi:hypothetical protein
MPFDATVRQDSEIVQILQCARDLLEQGWCQRAFYNADTHSFCIQGAIRFQCRQKALFNLQEYVRTESESKYMNAIGYVSRALHPNGSCEWYADYVFVWNDSPNRTKQEVLDVMDKAIALAREDNDAIR